MHNPGIPVLALGTSVFVVHTQQFKNFCLFINHLFVNTLYRLNTRVFQQPLFDFISVRPGLYTLSTHLTINKTNEINK